MAIAWFIVPYTIHIPHRTMPDLYPAERELPTAHLADITADGGAWAYTEIRNNRVLMKVRASAATLGRMTADYKRLPKARMDDVLSDVPAGQINALRDELIEQGYTAQEIAQQLGADMGRRPMRDVLGFMTRAWLKPRFDSTAQSVVCDGQPVDCYPPLDVVDALVGE
jgi:hypothetical protein